YAVAVTSENECKSRRLVALLLLDVERAFLGERARDARPLSQAAKVILERRPLLEIDRRCSRPVEHHGQISVGDAEPIEQKFAAGQVVVEVGEAGLVFFQSVGLGALAGLAIEQRAEQAFVQPRANEP